MGLSRMGPPDELILELASKFATNVFVETGTYEGYTSFWASKYFHKVFTIEMSRDFFLQTSNNFKHLDNIEFIYGDSRLELKKLLKT